MCCLQETHFRSKNTHRLKAEGWKMIFYAHRSKKKIGVEIFVPQKII